MHCKQVNDEDISCLPEAENIIMKSIEATTVANELVLVN